MVLGKMDRQHAKKKEKRKLDHLTLNTRKNSKWVKDLNVGVETMSILDKAQTIKAWVFLLAMLFF